MTSSALEETTLYWSSVASPHGAWLALATERGVCWTGTPGAALEEGVVWVKRWLPIGQVIEGERIPPLRQAVEELSSFLAGELRQFTCPVDMHGTAFQIAMWNAVAQIPYGETRSYQAIAKAINHPQAVRAVGAANGANPLAPIVPCHRVIGSNGSLTGYGGGLPVKAWLLAMEQQSKTLWAARELPAS
ncbi:MAG TPA: methylated-DNA--[protein]-cysteine S-methyltransferase [Ktedonobacterales bacterium]